MKDYIYYFKGATSLYIGQAGVRSSGSGELTDGNEYARLREHVDAAYNGGRISDNTVDIIRNDGLDSSGAQTPIFEAPNYGFKNFDIIFQNFKQSWEYRNVGASGSGNEAIDFVEMAHIMYHSSRQGAGGRKLTNWQLGGQQEWVFKDDGLFEKIWQVCGFTDMTKIQKTNQQGNISKRYKEFTEVVIRKWDTLDAVVKAISPLSYFIIRAILQGIESQDSQYWKDIFTTPAFVYLLIGGRGKKETRIQRAQDYLATEMEKFIQKEWEKAWDKIEASNILLDWRNNFQDLRKNGLKLKQLHTSPELQRSLLSIADTFNERIGKLLSHNLINSKIFQTMVRNAAKGIGSADAAQKIKVVLTARLTVAGRGKFKIDENGPMIKEVKNKIGIKRSWFYTSINTNRKFSTTPEWYNMILQGPTGWQNKKTPATLLSYYKKWTNQKFLSQMKKVNNFLRDPENINEDGLKAVNLVHADDNGTWLKMWFLSEKSWLGTRLKSRYETLGMAHILQHWDEFYRTLATANYGSRVTTIDYNNKVYYETPAKGSLAARRYKSSMVRGAGASSSVDDLRYF